MKRTDFFKEVSINNTTEYDHLNNTLYRFTMKYPVKYYRIAEDDVMRPDLISWKVYQTVDYWWLICFVNNIQDPFNDIISGDLIKIPNLLDVYEFYKKYKIQ